MQTPFEELVRINQVHMKASHLRPVLSTALSCWFGFLACLLGCAQPTLAAARCEQIQSHGLNSGSATSDTENSSSCCNHGGRAPGQRENRHNGASCCPLNATLAQKHDSVSPFTDATHVTVMPVSVTLFFPNQASDCREISSPTSSAGRDILLQVHVLRI